MNITHILGSFGPGGAEMGVVRLIRSFPRGDITHSVCSIGSNIAMKELLPEDTACYSLGIDGASYTAFVPLLRLFKKTKTSIAHVNNLASWFDVALASKLAGCRCIETFHGVEDDIVRFPLPRRILFKIASLMTHSVTAVAGAAAERMIKLTGIKRSKIRVIPNAVDTDFFRPCPSPEEKDKLRKDLDLPKASLLLGCVAALRPVKDHDGLLKAFAEAVSGKYGNVPNSGIYLVLVGDGVLESDLRRLAEKLGIGRSVIFLGRRNDIHRLLQALDVFVLNSKTEGMSYAILEAMAAGLPVIATAVGANTELIGHGKEGYLVPQGDIESMARYIFQIGNNNSVLANMGKNARKKVVDLYSIDKMITSYKALYERVYAG